MKQERICVPPNFHPFWGFKPKLWIYSNGLHKPTTSHPSVCFWCYSPNWVRINWS